MASSSRSARLGSLLLVLVLPGCWTGHLAELARRRESPVRFERAFVDAERLGLEYTVEVVDHRGESRGQATRSATLRLAQLAASPEIPLDELSVEVRRRAIEPAGEAVALLREDPREPRPPLALRIESGAGRDTGFRLIGPDPGDDRGRFRSGSLVRDRTALWFYPLLPFSVALDVAVLPVHVLGFGFFLVTPE